MKEKKRRLKGYLLFAMKRAGYPITPYSAEIDEALEVLVDTVFRVKGLDTEVK